MKPEQREETFAKGQILFREGDPSGDLWILRAGTVEVYREVKGRRFVLAHVKAGEMLGTMTATTGMPRAATVEAITEVKVTIVPKDQVERLIKGLPPWALGFIKDLVNRVHYADSLFIDSETSHAVIDGSPLQFAWRLAKTLAAVSEAMVMEVDGLRMVPLSHAVKTLGQVLGDPDRTEKVVAVLIAGGLLTPIKVTAAKGSQAVPEGQAQELALFADLLATVIQEQTSDSTFTMPLAQGERKIVQLLAETGRANVLGGERVVMTIGAIQDSFRKKGADFNVGALIRAQQLNFLQVDKAAADPNVTFDPDWLDYALKALNVIKDLFQARPDAGGPGKKTLLY